MALEDGSPQVELELEPVSRPARGKLPALLISAAALFVVIAVIKPWPAPTDAIDTGNHPLRTAQPSATGEPLTVVGESGYFQQCFPTANWRLTAIQDHGTLAVRTVWPAAPLFVATDPAGVDTVHVYGDNVEGIGFCAPGDKRATREARAATVSLWRRDARGALVPVDGARVIDHALAAVGEVYLAPPTPLATDGEWPVGDYFFEISSGRAGSASTWLALEVMPPPFPAATPTPSASPRQTNTPNG